MSGGKVKYLLFFLGTGIKIAIKVPRLVTDIFERVHDDAENRVMTLGIAALIKHSFTVVKHMLEGFFVTTEGALNVNSFPQRLRLFLVGRVSKNAVNTSFMFPLGRS